ncbi:cytochrome C oxidase subunit IV family protein [Pseudomonas sp. MTM4]|uniref:cytochrome C oxidase subunit IV family protein n=1 Tax=unclassified Pseudomonas TaxID=196821 RepID=UPI0010389B04|nr:MULTISPECIES: cytochrome C oxidase subunit IV family protein [unclassified Pseudomonas]MBC8651275.1 cytochrome C oxidase subunit IV family protein [Pseudomonas sp. MT4]QXY91807.1 cytochrome C oxidase subunit IV family protein [Pseudomonas sp. MTM4]TCD20726.1 hypothetical protein E0D86_15090 [Pseudomonas sp. IC_126]
MSASKVLIVCWLVLAALSTATVALGSSGSTLLLAAAVLVIALVKGWVITERFMEMCHAPMMWRLLMLGWPLVMAAGVILTLV